MRISVVSTLLLATSAIAGRSPQHVNKKLPERMRREPAGLPAVGLDKRAATKKKHHIIPQNKNTTKPSDWVTNSSSASWQAAQKTSESLKVAASTLHNQPIGLLQYLKAFRPWTAGLVGKERDMSFEISNLGAFKPMRGSSLLTMEKLVFSQPAKASGSLLDFNVVSVEGGSLALTVTWQKGVLGVGDEREEREFVRRVCGKLEESFVEVSASEI